MSNQTNWTENVDWDEFEIEFKSAANFLICSFNWSCWTLNLTSSIYLFTSMFWNSDWNWSFWLLNTTSSWSAELSSWMTVILNLNFSTNLKLNWLFRSSNMLVNKLSDWFREKSDSSYDLSIKNSELDYFNKSDSVNCWCFQTVVSDNLYKFCSSSDVKLSWTCM